MTEANGGSKPQLTIISSTAWAKTLGAEFRSAGYPVTYAKEGKVEQTEGGVLLVGNSVADSLSEDLLGRVVVFRIVPKNAGDLPEAGARNYIREQTAARSVLETVGQVVFGARKHHRLSLKLSTKLDGPGGVYRGRTVDLSLGGAAIRIPARAKPAPGERLTLKIDFGQGGPSLSCEATVQWLREERRFLFPKVVIGLRFDMADSEDEVSKFVADCQEFAVEVVAGSSGIGELY